jgi:hypothetical protein
VIPVGGGALPYLSNFYERRAIREMPGSIVTVLLAAPATDFPYVNTKGCQIALVPITVVGRDDESPVHGL